MIKTYFSLIVSSGLFSLFYTGIASGGLNTYTQIHNTLELKPASLSGSYKVASVCFAGNTNVDCRNEPPNYSNSATLCSENGFKLSANCPAYETPGQYCGYDSTYYDRCCNKAYKFTSDNCLYPNNLSTDNCSGKHKCICDRRLYSVNACTAPEEYRDVNDYCKEISYTAAGVQTSTTFYTGCKCPDNYKACGKNQVGIGDPCRTTLYKECKCDAKYDSTCSDFGPQNGHQLDFCLMDGTKYFQKNHCKTCPNLGQYDSCPDGYTCILEACSFKYYLAGCAVGYSPVGNCPWMEYFTKAMPLPTPDVE